MYEHNDVHVHKDDEYVCCTSMNIMMYMYTRWMYMYNVYMYEHNDVHVQWMNVYVYTMCMNIHVQWMNV